MNTVFLFSFTAEIEKNQRDEGKEEEKFIDVVINKNMKLGQKVLIPVKQFPKVSEKVAEQQRRLRERAAHRWEFQMALFIDNSTRLILTGIPPNSCLTLFVDGLCY